MALNFPSNPTTGQTYSYGGISYTYDSKRWVAATDTMEQASTKVATASTPPLNPAQGQMWLNSDTGTMSVYAYGGWVAIGSISSFIATGSVTSDMIANNTITATKLAAGLAIPSQAGRAGQYLTTNGSNVAWANVSTGISLSVSSTPPANPTTGSLWYDNVTTGELFVYSNNAWATTNVTPVPSVPTPIVAGATQAAETSTQTYSITNYNASYAYLIAVTSGTVTRSGSSIFWTLPSVTSNTVHNMTTQAVSGGSTSSTDTRTVLVTNLNVDDTAVIVTDFSYNNLITGWII